MFPGAGCALAGLSPSQSDFPNAALLVSGASVAESVGEANLVIIDARPSTAYAASHIPHAININYNDYYTFGKGLNSVTTLNSLLSKAGLTTGMTLVIYDNTAASFGAAGRLFWMFEYLGCQDVHILDGGWDKWVADKRKTETTKRTLPAAKFVADVQTPLKMTYEEINGKLGTSGFAIIDTRTDEEYIGWQLYGEVRGGHIPGAIQIPYAWYLNSDETVLNYGGLSAMFETRGVTPDKEVAAYCTCGIRSGYAYFLLRLMGYPMAANYDGSIAEWSSISSLPEEKAARFSSIVYPAWIQGVKDYASGKSTTAPPEYNYKANHPYVIFETEWGTLSDLPQPYLSGHIPGAIHSDSDIYENGYPRWFLNSDQALRTAAGKMGITPDTTVIVYSDSPIFAARLFWIQTYLGVKDVRFLNGGYNAWLAAGYKGETKVNNPVAATFPSTTPTQSQYLATTAQVYNGYKNNSIYIGDVRTEEEYIGAISGYSYVLEKGRIPTAIWLYDAMDNCAEYIDQIDGTLRSYTEVLNMWKSRGITSSIEYESFSKEMVFQCGSGYRSALAFLYAYMMGYDNIRNYSSGWEDWSTTYTYNTKTCVNSLTADWCQTPSGRPVASGFIDF
jgi:thiosulfate/3-mercaptopyruvate sulfurtransferase